MRTHSYTSASSVLFLDDTPPSTIKSLLSKMQFSSTLALLSASVALAAPAPAVPEAAPVSTYVEFCTEAYRTGVCTIAISTPAACNNLGTDFKVGSLLPLETFCYFFE
jgi:hypothetical protein